MLVQQEAVLVEMIPVMILVLFRLRRWGTLQNEAQENLYKVPMLHTHE